MLLDFAPSAPPFEEKDKLGLSYDQIIRWWNGLSEKQREDMILKGNSLSSVQRTRIRTEYKHSYPEEIYLQPKVLSVCDCYAMYYFFPQMQKKYKWDSSYNVFNLPPPYYSDQPPSYDEAVKWLNEQKKENLPTPTPQQIQIIRRQYHVHYIGCNDPHPLDYYLFSQYHFHHQHRFYLWTPQDYLFFETIRATCNLAPYLFRAAEFTTKAAIEGVKTVGSCLGEIGKSRGGGGGSGKDAGAILLGIAIVLGILATAFSALAGIYYAGKKAIKSVSNIFHGEKIARSTWRLTCTAGALALGIVKGMAIGALIGSVVPVIGTAIGAVLGGIFGGCISAGLGSAFGKYSAQGIAAIRTGGITNPDRWHIKNDSSTTAILLNTQKLKHTLKDKDSIPYHRLTDAVKSKVKAGEIINESIRVSPQIRFSLQAKKYVKETINCPMPIGLKC